jgi:hypothetical protein
VAAFRSESYSFILQTLNGLLFLCFSGSHNLYMDKEEQAYLTCNICGITVSASQANQHASTASHELNKATLKEKLNAVRKENYQNDSSLVLSWERSSV